MIKILLKYHDDGAPGIAGIQRVSTPGRRIYANKGKIPTVYGGLGISILTTSRGVLTGEQSRSLGVGGDVMCAVW